MNYAFKELFDLPKIEELLLGFLKFTNIPSAIVDLKGNVIVAAGWKSTCTDYLGEGQGNICPCCHCELGLIDAEVAGNHPHVIKKCIHGIIIAGAPIKVQEVPIAMIMFGQSFLGTPEFPIYSREKLDLMLDYFQKLAEMLGEMGLKQLNLVKEQRSELLREKKRLKTIFDRITNVGIQIYSEEGKVLYWNPFSEELFGWSSDDALGKTLDQLMFDRETYQDFLESIRKVKEGLQAKPKKWAYKDKRGKERIVFSTIVPLFEAGRYEFICMDIDLSEHERFEKELARLESLNLVGEMAASISHEIRNPLTTVRGFLQILAEKIKDENYQDYFQLMIQELDRATGIITEFLSLAKNRPIRLEKQDLNQIINALVPLIEANAIVANQTFHVQTEKLPPLEVDEKEIRQLILNLSRNAIEAMGNEGDLLIKSECIEDEVILSVHDTGPGIEPDILEKLGTPFVTSKASGTGLGLAVCYSIALRHNAVIEVKSETSGTTFMIRFKVHPEEEMVAAVE